MKKNFFAGILVGVLMLTMTMSAFAVNARLSIGRPLWGWLGSYVATTTTTNGTKVRAKIVNAKGTALADTGTVSGKDCTARTWSKPSLAYGWAYGSNTVIVCKKY